MTPYELCGRHLNEELRAVGKHQAERIAQHFSPIDGSRPFRLSWEFGQHSAVVKNRVKCNCTSRFFTPRLSKYFRMSKSRRCCTDASCLTE